MAKGTRKYDGNMEETKKKTDNCLPKHAARNMGGNTMIPSNKAFQKNLNVIMAAAKNEDAEKL